MKVYRLFAFSFALAEAVYEQQKDDTGVTGCWGSCAMCWL